MKISSSATIMKIGATGTCLSSEGLRHLMPVGHDLHAAGHIEPDKGAAPEEGRDGFRK